MKLSNSNFSKEIETAFKAAEEAGEIIDGFAENGFETELKTDGSRVTEADKKSQEKIVEIISEGFPGDGFLGEEDDLTPSGEDRVWVIDPIDGTFNFDRGFRHYCVSIALKIEGEAVFGLVYSPESSLEKTYLAAKDEGSYRTDSGLESLEKINVSDQSEIEDSIFFLSMFNIYEDEFEAEMKVMKKLVPRSSVHRHIGSCALAMCRVASGEADFQIIPIVKEWDYAAAKLIIEEAGGKVRIRESKFSDKTKEVVSSNDVLQNKVEEIVKDVFI